MSLRSTMARPTFTPALKVRSITAPLFRFRSFVRTNAPPLPGLTCWNSITWNNVPSNSRVIPFFRSFVDTLTRRSSSLQLDQLSRRRADETAAVLMNLHHVLDAGATEPRNIDPRFHGHDRPCGQHVLAISLEVRALVDLEADTVTQSVKEPLTVARVLAHRARAMA